MEKVSHFPFFFLIYKQYFDAKYFFKNSVENVPDIRDYQVLEKGFHIMDLLLTNRERTKEQKVLLFH